MTCNPLKCVCGKGMCPQRYLLVSFIALSILIAYGQRVNFNMVIAEMSVSANESGSQECTGGRPRETEDRTSKDDGSTKWTQEMQGILLGGFFVGYVIMHVPGGYLGDRFGGRYVLSTSVLISSVCTVLFCVIVDYTPFAVVVTARVVIGMAQASLFPNVTTLMSRWIPPKERAFMGGITFAAGALGIILGKLISGLAYVISGENWRPVFYIWGGIGLLWYALAMLYMFSDPSTHPFITEKEKERLAGDIKLREKDAKLRLGRMLIDPTVWALLMGQFGHDYLIFFLSTNMAKYFSDVQNLQMKDNMWASSIPYTLMWVSSTVTGVIADLVIKKGTDVGMIRKVYTTIASVFPSICILLIPYMGCNGTAVIVLLCLSLLTMGPFFSGMKVNVLDVCHNYSGVLMAFVNGFGAFAGVINPPIIGYLAKDNTFAQWKIVMWIIFGVATITNIIYLIWAKGERRPWDMNDEELAAYKERQAELAEEKKKKKEEKKAQKEAEKAQKEEQKKAKADANK